MPCHMYLYSILDCKIFCISFWGLLWPFKKAIWFTTTITILSYISVTILGVMFLPQTQIPLSPSPLAGRVHIIETFWREILNNKSIILSYIMWLYFTQFQATFPWQCWVVSRPRYCTFKKLAGNFNKQKHHSKLHNVALFHTIPSYISVTMLGGMFQVHLSPSPRVGTAYFKIDAKF